MRDRESLPAGFDLETMVNGGVRACGRTVELDVDFFRWEIIRMKRYFIIMALVGNFFISILSDGCKFSMYKINGWMFLSFVGFSRVFFFS